MAKKKMRYTFCGTHYENRVQISKKEGGKVLGFERMWQKKSRSANFDQLLMTISDHQINFKTNLAYHLSFDKSTPKRLFVTPNQVIVCLYRLAMQYKFITA